MATLSTTEPNRLRDRLRDWLGRLAIRLAPGDFEIDYQPGKPARVRGQIPLAKVGEIQEFLERDLQPKSRLIIRGTWNQRRMLRLRLAGAISPGAQQQTRNFLFELLR